MEQNIFIQIWASGIYDNLGQPANTSTSTISGYAIQPNTLGALNSLISTCFSGSGYTGGNSVNYQIGPDIGNTELNIIAQLYLVSYYKNLAQATMGIGGNTIPWSRIREGDSSIERSSPVSIGKEYRELSKDANEQLNFLVSAYRGSNGGNIGRSVDYPSEVDPTWGGSYLGP